MLGAPRVTSAKKDVEKNVDIASCLIRTFLNIDTYIYTSIYIIFFLKYIFCYLKVTRAKVTPLTNYIIGSESQIIVTVLHPWRVHIGDSGRCSVPFYVK